MLKDKKMALCNPHDSESTVKSRLFVRASCVKEDTRSSVNLDDSGGLLTDQTKSDATWRSSSDRIVFDRSKIGQTVMGQ